MEADLFDSILEKRGSKDDNEEADEIQNYKMTKINGNSLLSTSKYAYFGLLFILIKYNIYILIKVKWV